MTHSEAEHHFDQITPTVEPLLAKYPRPPGPESENNPLVLALPPVKSDDEWLEQLTSLPVFDKSQLQDLAYLRSYYVAELKNFFIPAERARQLSRRVDQLIRFGYAKRNPLGGEHFRKLQQAYSEAQTAKKQQPVKLVFSEVRPICSFSLIGVSGMGKSTTVDAVLAAYPQYLLHESFGLHQVVWLKIECPKDGSVKEVALNILRAFDIVLGTSHAPKSASRITVDDLMSRVKQLARAHCLGLLVLDELQNVSVRKSGGREELLNWFQELVNELKLPLLVLGTFKAREVLQLDARHSRRAGVMGGATWRPLGRGSEFDLLVDTLWSFQWLRSPGDLTEEIKAAFFEETQGIVAFMVDMYLVCQLYALGQGKETLTSEMFRHVARTDFEFLQPLLNALRSKQPHRLNKFSDMEAYDIDELIHHKQLLIPQTAAEQLEDKPGTSMVARASAAMRSALGVSDSEARRWVESVLTAQHKSHMTLTSDALAAFFKARSERAGDACAA